MVHNSFSNGRDSSDNPFPRLQLLCQLSRGMQEVVRERNCQRRLSPMFLHDKFLLDMPTAAEDARTIESSPRLRHGVPRRKEQREIVLREVPERDLALGLLAILLALLLPLADRLTDLRSRE